MEEKVLSTAEGAVVSGLSMEEKLLEVARYYQKTSLAQRSSQDPSVLVKQILQQVGEGRDTVSFAIPYNPAFIGNHKKRGSDGLDIATRESLNNIDSFCKRIAEITDKRVTFTLLYDSDLSFGLCKEEIARKADYLVGFEAIHIYI